MRHPALPETLTAEALAVWIRDQAREKFTDEQKIYFTEEEIAEMEKESTTLGREIIKIADLKKFVSDRLTKGTEEEVEITIPGTAGLKQLQARREELDRKVEKGYEVEETKIYGIPHDDGNMYFFDIEGNVFTDRTRKLSQRERSDIFGMFIHEKSATI